ncbi:MAG: hypothetical protein WAK17_13405, partial [Candidatus Nitrosopolaris sp.]
SFIFSLIIHLIFRSVNLVTELLLCVNNFGIGEWQIVHRLRWVYFIHISLESPLKLYANT